mmetsp:Transcript_20179/g.41162  ORF Transcript_20179/g.41162 Transcript_20179/m.41162 type:complete len:88 (+) Transcript_20179:517-780(+)
MDLKFPGTGCKNLKKKENTRGLSYRMKSYNILRQAAEVGKNLGQGGREWHRAVDDPMLLSKCLNHRFDLVKVVPWELRKQMVLNLMR